MLCIPSNIMNSLSFPYDIYANLVGFHTLVPVIYMYIHLVIPSRKGIFMRIWLTSANRFMGYADKRVVFFCLKFSSLCAGVTLKIGQGHQNLFSSSSCHNVTVYTCKSGKICQQVHTSNFCHTFSKLSPGVTLKIRWRSAKHNQLFIMS